MARRATASSRKPAQTKRQREGQRIGRERAARQRRQKLGKFVLFGLGGAVALGVLGTSFWGWKNGLPQQVAEQMRRGAVRVTADSGFVVKNIYLEGRESVPLETIKRVAGIGRGDPIFATSVAELKSRLETVPGVRTAAIERVLPDTLHIHIVERRPVAIWQHEQVLQLIDDNGTVMAPTDAAKHESLLLVVGEDAPQHAMELLEVLTKEKALFSQVKAAIRVGGRRWNIRFQNGVEVKLPERDMAGAWERLASMQAAQNVLARNIVGIDLRLADRVYFKLPASAPNLAPAAGRRASET